MSCAKTHLNLQLRWNLPCKLLAKAVQNKKDRTLNDNQLSSSLVREEAIPVRSLDVSDERSLSSAPH